MRLVPVMRRALVLLMCLLAGAGSAHGADRPWRVIRGKNVEVFGVQPPRTLREVAIELEQFRVVLGSLIRGAREPQPAPTQVYIFDDEQAMRPFVPLYEGKPASLGGYCHCGSADEESYIVASLSRYSESAPLIYHEYTHLLMRNAMTDIPVWFNEGIAEYYSTFAMRASAREAQVGRPIARHVQLLRERFIPLAELLEVTHSSPLYNEGTRRSIFYAEAWALTHYLLLGRQDGVATMNKYLTAYAAGAESEQALTAATGMPLKALETELRRYVGRMLFRAVTYTLSERIEVDEPDAARALDGADAEARLGEIQLRVDRLDEAARRIEGAAAAQPPVARARFALALLRLRQDRSQEAPALLEQAAAMAPDDFATQYLYGLTLLRGLGDLSDGRWPSERAARARTALARAVALRPDSATALAWLGYAGQETATRLDEAREATRKAVALAPGRLDYVLQLAELQAQLGEVSDAQRLLAPLSRASDQSVARRATRLLDTLNARAATATRNAAMPTAGAGPAAPVPRTAGTEPERETLDLSGGVRYLLRKLQPGESRTFGELLEIACGPTEVRFRLRRDGGDIAAPAKRMEDVELTSFGDSHARAISCGARVPPDKVYLTRAADGTVVAVEFMPGDFVP